MYERFTDRVRKIMQLANQEAQRLNHEYLGVEHLLLAMAKEGTGFAALEMHKLNLSHDVLFHETMKFVDVRSESVTMGKLPQTVRAKQVIANAVEEARALDHNFVGDEHLLLALLREAEGPSAQILKSLGVNAGNWRLDLLAKFPAAPPGISIAANISLGDISVVHRGRTIPIQKILDQLPPGFLDTVG